MRHDNILRACRGFCVGDERVREAGTGAASTRAAGTGAAGADTGTAGTGTAGPGTAGTGSGRVVDETQNKQGQTGMEKMMDPKHYTDTNTNTTLTLSIEGGLG